MSKVLFLGSGDSFTGTGLPHTVRNNYHSNMVLTGPSGKRLLIDCGSDVRFSLGDQNLSHRDIDAVYISHLHGDHAGGLEWLGFSTYFDPHCGHTPQLFVSNEIVAELWKMLKPAMGTIPDTDATLEKYFLVQSGSHFYFDTMSICLVKNAHIISKKKTVFSYGLFIEVPGTLKPTTIYITSDSVFDPESNLPNYKAADIIFQDCFDSPFFVKTHANYCDLKTLDPSVKSKMWLYHLIDGPRSNAREDGFAGFVSRGDVFSLPGGKE